MNTFFSVVILVLFMSLFVYLMYKIVTNTLGDGNSNSTTDSASGEPPYNDTPTAAQQAEYNSVRSSAGTGIVATTSTGFSLRDVVIKASYNSAFTGTYVNLDMIKEVLSRGCRFLDFQVFVRNGNVVVGYSNATYDPSFTSMTSLNCLSLAGVCTTIMANAFSDTSPNKDDPLFVQFHIKTLLTDSYETIAAILSASFSEKLYGDSVSGTATPVTPEATKISEIMGKIVILIDAPQIQDSLAKMTNLSSGTATVPMYNEAELVKQMYSPSNNSPYLFRIVQPTLGFYLGLTNADSKVIIYNYGAQVVTEAFYINDNNLNAYEKLFENFNSAIVPMTSLIGYIKNSQKSV